MPSKQENLKAIGGATGAIVGSIIPGAGTAIGATIGVAAGTIVGALVDHINWLKSKKKPISGKELYEKYKSKLTYNELSQIKNNVSKISSDPVFFTEVAYAIQSGYFNSKTPYMKDFWNLWFADLIDYVFPKSTKQERRSVVRLYNVSTGQNIPLDYLPEKFKYLNTESENSVKVSNEKTIENSGIFVDITKPQKSEEKSETESKKTTKSKSFLSFLIDLITR